MTGRTHRLISLICRISHSVLSPFPPLLFLPPAHTPDCRRILPGNCMGCRAAVADHGVNVDIFDTAENIALHERIHLSGF